MTINKHRSVETDMGMHRFVRVRVYVCVVLVKREEDELSRERGRCPYGMSE